MTIEMTRTKQQKIDLLCYLFLIFLISCLAGWVYEEILCWITEGVLRNRGILYGPWLPIYGVGALCIYGMKPVKKHPVLLFLLCAATVGTVEYIIGFVGIRFFGLRLWDYREMLLNLDGIICLSSVLCFAVMGLVFHYLLEPTAQRMVGRIRPQKVRAVCLVLLLLFVADCIFSALFRTPITY